MALTANVYGLRGTHTEQLEGGVNKIMDDIQAWYNSEKVDASLRISDLSLSMLGSERLPSFSGKAAETGVLVRWATQYIREHAARVREHGGHMALAGPPLVRYMDLLRTSPQTPTDETCREFCKCFREHVHHLAAAGARYLPKHHAWGHMTYRIRAKGNPKYYSTFMDETLNAVISAIAQCSHRRTWTERIFQRLHLQAIYRPSSYFFAGAL